MEKESSPLKLTTALAMDYPDASEVLVSFPDEWELVRKIVWGKTSFYVSALPTSQEKPSPAQFHGLSPEISLQLTTYRMYRLFQPWPMPSVYISWDQALGQGQVEGVGETKVQLQLAGQAQAWFGQRVCVLWEGYLNEVAREAHGQDLLLQFWKAVEESMAVSKLFTQPHEPTFEKGYTEFLRSLGYAPDPDYRGWWSKERAATAGK